MGKYLDIIRRHERNAAIIEQMKPQDGADAFAVIPAGWTQEQWDRSAHKRLYEAYMARAAVGYRPGAPGDGFGHIHLTLAELRDRERLVEEAMKYVARFRKEENGQTFWTGCSNFGTNRAFVWVIEAARLLCGGDKRYA
jgi:hypothetical protein